MSPPAAQKSRSRLASYMDDRRQTLRLTWKQVSDKAGLSPQGLRDVRAGEGAIRPLTKRGLEDALDWAAGSIDAVLAGGEPTPVGDSERGRDDGRRIDAQLDQNEAILSEIDGLLRKASPSHTRAVLELLKALNDEEGRASAG